MFTLLIKIYYIFVGLDWGYNTKQQREAAHDNPKITVIGMYLI